MTEVRVVLDATALTAYAQLKGLATAELIRMVEEDGGVVGIPAASFVTAFESAGDGERRSLVRLATDAEGVTAVLPLLGPDAVEVATIGADLGHAVVEARRHDAYLATYAGAEARRHLDDDAILDLGD